MAKIEILTGNYAVAYGAKLSRVQVVSAYPITPQTTIVEKLADLVSKGELNAKYVCVESEHSAMAACIGASATGARAFTATSSHGLLYMSELVWWAGLGKFPLVMAVVCRALAPPWSIWTEHNDVLAHRDCGWIIFFAEDNQEVLDLVIQSYRIGEDERVLQPVMVALDAFILSHTSAPVSIPEQVDIDGYLPPPGCRKLPYILDPDNPYTYGNMTSPEYFMELRYEIERSMNSARKVIVESGKRYGEITGRYYDSLIEPYKCGDANVLLISVGSSVGDGKEAVDRLRDDGYNVGLVKLRTIRPFPFEELKSICGGRRYIGVLDRNYSFGFGGVVYSEVSSALQGLGVPIQGFIAGLGGRDITIEDYASIFKILIDMADRGLEPKIPLWIGLKEGLK
ncbi:MAG: transketolase C-terminal domain-containing protein [Candidatus Methanomethylicia archaeon]